MTEVNTPSDLAARLRQIARLHTELTRLRAVEKACGDLVVRMTLTEQAYHMYPSFDRPVEGCDNCGAVEKARVALREKGVG